MTERGRDRLNRDTHNLSIGPSSLAWENDTLTVKVDEIAFPALSRIRGTVKIRPVAIIDRPFGLDALQRHVWRPIAPRAAVEVSLREPACDWRGQGYFDTNAGEAPLQDDFSAWDWSRAHLNTDTLLFYDTKRRDGGGASLALRVGAGGDVQAMEPLSRVRLPSTLWRIDRNTRAEIGETPTVRRTLEDTPFYARSILNGRYDGQVAQIVHESLSVDRLRSPIVRAMLPFRMPRSLR